MTSESEASGPSTAEIGRSQNTDGNLRRYAAAARYYWYAKLLHFGGRSVTVILALASPLVLLFSPDLGPALGAVAGGWLFVSRLVCEPWRQGLQLKGATAQEMFDCAVLKLEWNETVVRRLAEEEIRSASGSMKRVGKIRDWYPTESPADWPESVLLCQRSNAVWARRQHRAYAWVLVGAAVVWWIVGVVVAVADTATLADYLVIVGLPSLPALLDAGEFARAHLVDAQRREQVEDRASALLQAGEATQQDLREIQDQLFELRRDAQLVPGWFYKLIRPKFEADMQYAARLATTAQSDQRRDT